jgi:hypothetical protein
MNKFQHSSNLASDIPFLPITSASRPPYLRQKETEQYNESPYLNRLKSKQSQLLRLLFKPLLLLVPLQEMSFCIPSLYLASDEAYAGVKRFQICISD